MNEETKGTIKNIAVAYQLMMFVLLTGMAFLNFDEDVLTYATYAFALIYAIGVVVSTLSIREKIKEIVMKIKKRKEKEVKIIE